MRTKRTSLQLRLHSGFLVVALSGLAVAAFLVDRNVERMTMSMVEERLSNQALMLGQLTASALFGPLDESDSGLNDDVRALGVAVHARLSLIALDGRVIADSESKEPLSLPSEGAAPEIVAALMHHRAAAVRMAGSGLQMFVAQAIIRDGKILGLSRSSLPMDAVITEVMAVRKRMAWGAGLAALLAIALAVLISSRIVRPVRELTDAARKIEGGALGTKISVPQGDEIADLADAFNKMTDALSGTIAKLDSRNRDMGLVLDNVSDGLLIIDRDGLIGSERSAVVERWFGTISPGTKLWEYVAASDARAAKMFELGWEAVCEDVLPLALTLAQMPHRLTVKDRIYEFAYEPILSAGVLVQALVVISDVTERVEAERAILEQQEFSNLVERLLKDRTGLLDFAAETDAIVRRLATGKADLVEAQRSIHTLRGSAAMYGLTGFAELCKVLESRMHDTGELPEPPDMSALCARWARLASRLSTLIGGALHSIEFGEADRLALERAVERGVPKSDLIKMIRELKLEPAEKSLARLAAQAKALGPRLGKGPVNVVVDGGSVRLDTDRWRPFFATLGHVIRNAVDHGLEAPDERRRKGKPEQGRIELSAKESQGAITIEISDDGRGIDWDALEGRAGLSAAVGPSRDELLFAHGVTTRSTVSEHSGRGVGLSAVRAALDTLGGRVQVITAQEKGTRFRFVVPAVTAKEEVHT